MQQLILTLHVLVSITIIILVLLQHGKGADAGAAFGSGSSNTMFGSTGATPFLVKLTAVLAATFFTTSLALGYFASRQVKTTHTVVSPATSLVHIVPATTTSKNTVKIPTQSKPAK